MHLGILLILFLVFQECLTCGRQGCPSSRTYNAAFFKKYTTIDWEVGNVFGYRITQIRGKAPGSKFYEGNNVIKYKFKGILGITDYCTFSINIKVIRCRRLGTPNHGSKACDNDENIYGTDCDFTCDSGWTLSGYERSRCEEHGYWSHSTPTCSNDSPSITCPTGNTHVASFFKSSVSVTWEDPDVDDDTSGYRLYRTGGDASGSSFDEGSHTISYKVKDAGGLTDYCSFTFKVKVIKCSRLETPDNGNQQCDNDENIYGTDCDFTCDKGFVLIGYKRSRCQEDGHFNQSAPTCNRVSCPYLNTPAHSRQLKCTNKWYFESVCSLDCDQGYTGVQGYLTVCQNNKQWSNTDLKCEDTERPTITNCPRSTIKSYSKVVTWPPLQVQDNSGSASISLSWGQHSGSSFSVGAHVIKYDAQDSAGNKADPCVFTVKVEALFCPHPSHIFTNDSDLEFMDCSTNLTKFVENTTCQTRCKSGTLLHGAQHVTCERNTSLVATANWVPKNAEKPNCPKRACHALRTPKNGAIVCDTFLSETLCQLQCDLWYDIPEYSDNMFICGQNSKNWAPSNVTEDCREVEDGEVYSLPSELYYFTDTCDKEETKNEIKNNFITALKESILFSHVCYDPECRADNVVVTCGNKTDLNTLGRDDAELSENLLWPESSMQKSPIGDKMSFADPLSATKTSSLDKLLESNVTVASESLRNDSFNGNQFFEYQNVSTAYSLSRDSSSGDSLSEYASSGDSFKGNNGQNIVRLVTLSFDLVVSVNLTSEDNVEELLTSIVHDASIQLKKSSNDFPQVNYKIFNMSMQCHHGFTHAKTNNSKCVVIVCDAGTYHNSSLDACTPCPINTYQYEEGKTSCLTCPPGTITLGNGTNTIVGCIENKPPNITCPPGGIYNAMYFHKYANMYWPDPHVSDEQDGYSVTQIEGEPSGSKFQEGSHTITYKVTDAGGLTNYCSWNFTIKVVRCENLETPDNGSKSCDDHNIFGTDCFFSCDTGFEIDGYIKSSCKVDGHYNHPAPTCNRLKCPKLKLPEQALRFECTDENYLHSICTLECKKGFMGKFGSFTHCGSDKTWSNLNLRCAG